MEVEQAEIIRIERRYNGPPNSGNGGYVSGLLASRIEGIAEVTLRMPPPLEQPLSLIREDQVLKLMDGDKLIAEAKCSSLDLEVPKAPSIDVAAAAVNNYSGFDKHSFPTCFVCGPERGEGDGLRIFAGSFDGPHVVAAPWRPNPGFLVHGRIPTEIHWAAMDCPGAFAVMEREKPVVLGRMTAEIVRSARAGEQCIVMGWAIRSEGRKHFAGTALFSESGEVLARAHQTWIELQR